MVSESVTATVSKSLTLVVLYHKYILSVVLDHFSVPGY